MKRSMGTILKTQVSSLSSSSSGGGQGVEVVADDASQSTAPQEVPIPESVKPKIQVNYSNVLPSKLRHGNQNVMPLWPDKVD